MRAPTRRPAPALAGAVSCAALALTACGVGGSGSQPPRSTAPAPEEPRAASPTPSRAAEGRAVLLTIGDTTVAGQLWVNPAAADLESRLPVTLVFGDYNGVEKTARLDRALTMVGMPAGDDPEPGEIGWYEPSSDLVLYYGDVGFWDGIARLGTFDPRGIALLAGGPRDITVTIAPAD